MVAEVETGRGFVLGSQSAAPRFEISKTISVPAEIYEWKASPSTRQRPRKFRNAIGRIFWRHFPMVWRCWVTNGISRGMVNSCWAGGMKTGCIRLEIHMKIESITLREIHMPLVHFFETSFGRLYSRRILLLTIQCEGVDGWGECVAGEDPFYSSEWIETAWPTIKHYLAPAVLGRTVTAAHEARASWPKYAGTAWPRLPSKTRSGTRRRFRSSSHYGSCSAARRREIQCGVSIGIQDSVEQLIGKN